MAEICMYGIEYPKPWFEFDRTATECKGSPLAAIAGIAISIAVPFIAPAIAGAIFGSSVMAGLGGILATAGTGAVLGGVGAAITGGDWKQGALFGALGSGLVQGVGGFGSTASPLFGSPITGANAVQSAGLLGIGSAAPVGGAAAGVAGAAAPAATAGAAGLGITPVAGALGASAAAPAAQGGLAALGAGLPWDKLGNAAAAVAPMALGSAISELTPPSDAALQAEALAKQQMEQDQELYNAAMSNYNNINPEYFAQNAANAAKLQVATAAAEGARTPGLYDPARYASDNRKAAVAGVQAAGTAYNDSYLTALEAQKNAQYSAQLAKPNYGQYSDYLATYGADAEREKRAEELTKWITPFSDSFMKTETNRKVTG